MNKKFFSGDSIDQAVMQAARYFKVDPEEVAYREVERRHGFLRTRRRAVIEVDTENPTRPREEVEQEAESAAEPAPPPAESRGERPEKRPEPARERRERRESRQAEPEEADESVRDQTDESDEPEAEERRFGETRQPPEPEPEPESESESESEPEPEPESESAAPARRSRRRRGKRPFQELSEDLVPPSKRFERAEGEVAEAAQAALARLFELGRLDLNAEIWQGDERLQVELRGADEEALLEDRGRLLLAIQHLLPRMLRGLTGQSSPCWVDCDNFHEIRTEQLRDLAQRVATEVRNSRRSRMLEPMSPDERRIVHITLADDPAVETVSQGNGLFKRVQVRPQKKQPRGFDPYSR